MLYSAQFPIWVEEIVCEQVKGNIRKQVSEEWDAVSSWAWTQTAMSMTTRTRGVRWSETCAEAWGYDANVVRRRWN